MDYLFCVIAEMQLTKLFPDWRPIFDWMADGTVQRFTGSLRSQGIQYWLEPGSATNWTQLLAANGKSATSDGNFPAVVRNESPHYPARALAAVETANHVDPATRAKLAEATTYLRAQVDLVNYVPWRMAVKRAA